MTTDEHNGSAPFFSVITVTKDNRDGLRSTKDSIDAQSCTDFEWIVIDGDSTDGTKDCPFVTLREPDRGIYDAMNKGLARATGRYVIFMNAGDRFADADNLATVKRAATASNADFIYGDALESNGLYKKARDAKNIALGMPTHHQAMLYALEKIAHAYDLAYTIAADYDFTARFLLNGAAAHYMPCALCVFEDGGISQQRRAQGRKEQFRIRHTLNLCNPITNAAIYLWQSLSATLREHLPALYFALRK